MVPCEVMLGYEELRCVTYWGREKAQCVVLPLLYQLVQKNCNVVLAYLYSGLRLKNLCSVRSFCPLTVHNINETLLYVRHCPRYLGGRDTLSRIWHYNKEIKKYSGLNNKVYLMRNLDRCYSLGSLAEPWWRFNVLFFCPQNRTSISWTKWPPQTHFNFAFQPLGREKSQGKTCPSFRGPIQKLHVASAHIPLLDSSHIATTNYKGGCERQSLAGQPCEV